MENRKIYEDITLRTNGDIYIGVVGPVRTGKSTFIKRFMETLVLPEIENVYRRDRARDELPQSGSGRVVMTAEPKFVPEEAVDITMDNGAMLSVRLIDCVGYMVPGAMGQTEGGLPRMVTTPWFDHEIPMTQAAEIGTQKVIADHSTIGIVVTTDGTITDIPREDYLEAEERVISELKELGKPFMVLLNSAAPQADLAQTIQADISEKYDVTCLAVNCLTLDEDTVSSIIKGVLYEFPMKELDLYLPAWVDALPFEHPIKSGLYGVIREETAHLRRLRDLERSVLAMGDREEVSRAELTRMDMGTGVATATLEVPRALFYSTLSQQCGMEIGDDGDLMKLMTELAAMKSRYDKVSAALDQVESTGYGIVMPDPREMKLEEPEIVKQGGRYGVRLKASAPSIHIMRYKQKFRTDQLTERKSFSSGVGRVCMTLPGQVGRDHTKGAQRRCLGWCRRCAHCIQSSSMAGRGMLCERQSQRPIPSSNQVWYRPLIWKIVIYSHSPLYNLRSCGIMEKQPDSKALRLHERYGLEATRSCRTCFRCGIYFWGKEVQNMSSRVAVMSIIVEDSETVEKLNGILHEYSPYIIGRMGIPYHARKINIISIAIDAPQDKISALAGRIGNLPGISVKTALSNVMSDES